VDDKKFKEELSKIARWYIPIVTEKGDSGRSRKPKPDSQPNEMLGPIIQEMLPRTDTCAWCGLIGDVSGKNHILKFTSMDGRRPARRWEHNCQSCKRQMDPATGRAKERPKSKYQLAKEAVEKGQGTPRPYWWNNPAVYTDSDKNKPGENKA
jgi:hypothetical protein